MFSSFPRTMTLDWDAVPGANSYIVEIDSCSSGSSCTDADNPELFIRRQVADTGFTFDFAGAQPGPLEGVDPTARPEKGDSDDASK